MPDRLSARELPGIDQYTIRTSKKLPTQEEKEAAAANYQKVREAYLITGTPSLQSSGRYPDLSSVQ